MQLVTPTWRWKLNKLSRTCAAAGRLPHIGTRRGVVKASELALGDAAQSVVDDARDEANAILEAARLQAADMLESAREMIAHERERAIAQAEQAVWRLAADRQLQYDQQLTMFTNALEQQALDVVSKAVAVLAAEVPPAERIRSSLRALMAQVAGSPTGSLRVSEQDIETLESMRQEIPWPLQADRDVQPGDCLLVAERGSWSTSFAGRLQSLQAALQEVPEINPNDMGE
jgi:flagellar biosynthesis/type III secretory pathway protein FliH